MKEEFFSKFIDYNNRLEKILETKDFSTDVKNLLLSMLYKIDTSYADYQMVKRNVKNKQDFLEDVIRIVENCESIELIKPNSEEGKIFEEKKIKYQVDPLRYEIKTLENEKVMLEALFELDPINFYLPEKYNLIRIAFPDLLNEGKSIGNVEIIRDFNAWSWNVLQDEISNLYANLIYQNLAFLMGQEELEDWLITDEIENKIEWLTDQLSKENKKEEVNRFLNLIYQISIDSCINKNAIEKRRLLDEKMHLQEEYQKRRNKETYLEDITQMKKDRHKEIENIDRILNDKQLLQKEYRTRNQTLREYNKILNIDHLIELLNKQRKKAVRDIEQCNDLLQPQKYIETEEKIKQQLELLEDVGKKEVTQKKIEEKMVEMETIFLMFFQEKIKQATKKELLNFIYMFRYYEEIPFNQNKKMRQVQELSALLEEIEEILINRMYEMRQIAKISEDKNFNMKILKNIFNTKIINLENICMQLKRKEEGCVLELYDKETLEKQIKLSDIEKETKEFKVKKNKIIKIFI